MTTPARVLSIFLLALPLYCRGAEPARVVVPWSRSAFSANEGCAWLDATASAPGPSPGPGSGPGWDESPRGNAHYLAAPAKGEDWSRWLAKIEAYRRSVRAGLHDASSAAIDLRFDGVRAWIRTGAAWAWALDPAPGETLELTGEARWIEGNSRLCVAFDLCDRAAGVDCAWRDWSTVVASADVPRDGRWHPLRIAVKTPAFDAAKRWARPIVGMDGTFDKTPGHVAVRKLQWTAAARGDRPARLAALAAVAKATPSGGFKDAVYGRKDLAWSSRNFVCGFLFIYDRSFWDPQRHAYRIDGVCDDAVREFGGYDSVVLWHAYPRIGADQRNQFDFFRDMPGPLAGPLADGLAGVRDVVRAFHRRGVKVFLPYNPWDTGTAREKESDEKALARLVAATESDGLFLDTMIAAPTDLRDTVDAARRGVVFEPEGHPSIEEMEQCSASWAQWLAELPEIGLLRLKWIEPRHMQHQIRRWDKTHQPELAAAWLNGSGMLVWENIFGTWNPWNAQDRATLRRMVPVLRHFADHFSAGRWLPYYPVATPGAYASCWEKGGARLWTLVSPKCADVDVGVTDAAGKASVKPNSSPPIALEIDDRGERLFDLWRGVELQPKRVGNRLRIELPATRYGAVAALPVARVKTVGWVERSEPHHAPAKTPLLDRNETSLATADLPLVGLAPLDPPYNCAAPNEKAPGLDRLLTGQRRAVRASLFTSSPDAWVAARSVIDPEPPPACRAIDAAKAAGMLRVEGGQREFVVRHMRRECGCYPDPGTPAEKWDSFLAGNPHDAQMQHRVKATLAPHWVDAQPVTNAQFERFVKASGYRPRSGVNYLKHWNGPACPAQLRDQPVAYVDFDDARAYAAWAGRRLPTEWEWHEAARLHGAAFRRGEVWEWTESRRDDGHTRFVMLRGGCRWKAEGSIWYFPTGVQPIETHAKFILLDSSLDRCATIGFRCAAPAGK